MLMYILTQNNTIIAKNKLTIWRLRSNIRIFAMFKTISGTDATD